MFKAKLFHRKLEIRHYLDNPIFCSAALCSVSGIVITSLQLSLAHRDIFPQLQQLSGPGCLLATSLSSANTSFCSRDEGQMFVQRKVFGDFFICCIELSITCSQCLFQKSQYGERVEVALNIYDTRMRWRWRRAGAGW